MKHQRRILSVVRAYRRMERRTFRRGRWDVVRADDARRVLDELANLAAGIALQMPAGSRLARRVDEATDALELAACAGGAL